MNLYTIIDWDEHFEFNESRKRKGKLSWVKVPSKFDGDGITELLDHRDGAAHYGAWVAAVLIAGKCKPRGVLVRENGKPYTPHVLSRQTGIDSAVFQAMLDRVTSEDIMWMSVTDYDANTCIKAPTNVADDTHLGGTACPRDAQHIILEERKEEERREEESVFSPIDFTTIVYPDGFDSDDVRAAFVRWVEYKTKRNQPPFDPEQMVTLCLQRFAAYRPDELIRQINRAIESEWRTIQDPAPRQTAGTAKNTPEEILKRMRQPNDR